MLSGATTSVFATGRTRPSRREEIMEGAAGLFAARGFAGVTVDDIGAACGVSGPALYHHFVSKEAVLGEMLVSISTHLADGADRIVAALPRAVDAMDALIGTHVSFALDRPDLITIQARDLVYATYDDQTAVRRLQRRYVERWVAVLERVQPNVDVRLRRAAVHAVFGLVNSTPYLPPVRTKEVRSLLTAMAHGALACLRETDQGLLAPSRP